MGARQAILDHVRHWNAMDKDVWLALFADDVVYEDPPGTVASRGAGDVGAHVGLLPLRNRSAGSSSP